MTDDRQQVERFRATVLLVAGCAVQVGAVVLFWINWTTQVTSIWVSWAPVMAATGSGSWGSARRAR